MSEMMKYKNNSQIKDVDEKKGIIEGYANVYNVRDLQGDISLPGSFTKSVNERLKKIKIYRNHDRDQFVGVPEKLDANDPYGLFLAAKLNMSTEIGRNTFLETKFLIDNGFEAGFSIGAFPLKFNDIRDEKDEYYATEIQEWKLYETSVLTCDPANELSFVNTVKSVAQMDAVTQEEFWRVVEKAYNIKFSDKILKSLEEFLTLKEEPQPTEKSATGTDSTLIVEPQPSIITQIYSQFIK